MVQIGMSERRRYPINQSRLYKVASPGRLARELQIDLSDVDALIGRADNYIRFITAKGRDVQWPKPLLRKAHKRAATLLSRIETPDFLYSAVRGRSYVANAKRHAADQATVKIDLRKFYQSVRAAAVFHFFSDTMLCAPHVAAVLTKLLTVDGHLPTGSSVSPILSYFAYSDMFSEIDAISHQRNCVMTCYVDDMTFTGRGATRALIYEVKKVVHRYHLWAHKTKIFQANQPKVITGVAITRDGGRLPNKRQRTIADDQKLLGSTVETGQKIVVAKRIASRMQEAAQVDSAWHSRAVAMTARAKGLEPSSG